MGFLKKMMAAVGVGGAAVDARVQNPAVRIGEDLTGVVVVRGGAIEQRIERLNLGLATRYKSDDSYVTHTLFSQPVVGGFEIRPGETREFPFRLTVPAGTPLTLPGTAVWLVTDADIAGAMDPGDNDPLQILPSREMEVVIAAADRLGFRLSSSEVEYHHGRIVQELSFRPPYGQYRISELEMMMFPAAGGLDVILEVDRRATGLASLFTSEFEQKGRWHVPAGLLAGGPDAVARELQARVQRLS
ncbi:Gram-positive sporulation control protein Spo0M-like protein [Deinococcus aerius]|uniref:Gram-positive sporulation control protein Spo0M-like protein n=1 Tax=Deinococcus aerius TaxID=200253 RepID=A0A2I9CUW1_9DEIO|nr:sporulation protein [Deinococcus aerius]GBF05663.1 Gram-positive sporulation control protein Spo0M-like protein [Deinococcus aerius]